MIRKCINCYLIIVFITLFILSLVEIISYNNHKNVYSPNTGEENGIIYPIIEQFVYDIFDDFMISFNIESEYDVETVSYENEGFCVVDKPIISNKKITLCLQNDGIVSNPTIKICVDLSNGKTISTRLYGIIENDKLYLNKNSFDAARDIYFSELLKNDIIDNREYEKLLMNSNKKSVNVNTGVKNELELPRSSNGGWVTGSCRWEDDCGNWHPLQYTKVSIYDEDPLNDECLGTVYTDVDGEFIFSFDDNIDGAFDSSGRDIFIKVWPQGTNSVVKSGTNNEYVIRSNTYWDVLTGETTPIDCIDISMNSDLGRAFQVSQAIITCANYASIMRGTSMENINVRYPHNDSSEECFYRDFNDTIYIIGNRYNDLIYDISGHVLHSYASWDMIMHEYGHFIQDKLDIADNPGKKHWVYVNMYDHYMSHHNGGPLIPDCDGECANPSAPNAKDKAIKIAYAESWPSILGAIAQQYYINLGELDNNIVTVGDDQYTGYNGVICDYNDGLQSGEAVESAVMGVLWDIYDNDAESYDTISLGPVNWWNLTVGGSPKTLSDLVSRFYSLYSSYVMWDPFDKLLEYYKMSPDDIDISGTIMSYLVPTITWTDNGTSSSLLNNSFRVMIYNSSYSLVVDYYTTNTSITLSQEQWNSIIMSGGDKFYIKIGGSQTNAPSTGYYYSALKEYSKPKIQTTLENGTISIIGYYGWTPSNLIIQSSYNGLPTTIIGENAFNGCISLESITIPNSVESIRTNAFKNCSYLENVIIHKSKASIINLGLNAFDNCSSNLTITVPTNRLCEYKNTPFWSSYRSRIVPSYPIVNDIDLDCMIDSGVTTYLNAGYNKLYRLDVECDGWYTISISNDAHFNIYNSNMVKIDESHDTYELTLIEGTYYIDVEWDDEEDYGNVTLHFFNKGINVSSIVTNNILPHLHQVDVNDYRVQLKYYNNQGPGFYNIIVNATSINPITYYEGTITFYSNYNRSTIINKYSDNNYTLQAKSSLGASSMVMYFEDNGYYYFDVILRTNDLTSLTLNINPLTTTNLNLFDLNENNNDEVELLINDIQGDCFKKVVLKQHGNFELTGCYNDYSSEDAYVLIARIIQLNNSYSLDVKLISIINDNYTSISEICSLEPDTYYIGYYNNIEGEEISISLERIISQSGQNHIVADTYDYDEYGSEVRFNNGLRGGTTLTVGFTRFIYLDSPLNVPSISRLDYYWYSSNDNIATISEYGTLLGKSAGSVKIMAVYKNNPSITYVKEFTILTDNRLNDLIINNVVNLLYSESGQLYQVSLNDYNSYFPQNTLYNWSVVSSYNNWSYNISIWGTIQLSGQDIIVIEGVSTLNSKLKIRLTLTIS